MDSQSFVKLHAQFLGEKRNITIPRAYLDATDGDYVAAVVLREVVFGTGWSFTNKDDEGWFYRNEKEWQDGCYLSLKRVTRAVNTINKIAGAQVIERKVRRVRTPDGAVLAETATHYRLDGDRFMQWMGTPNGQSRNGDSGSSRNGDNGSSRNCQDGQSLTYTQQTTQQTAQHTTQAQAPADGLASQHVQDIRDVVATANKKSTTNTARDRDAERRRDARGYMFADAYFAAAGYQPGDVDKAERARVKRVLEKVPARFGVEDMQACIAYLRTDDFWKRPGALTAKKVAETIVPWDAQGRPGHAGVGSGKGSTPVEGAMMYADLAREWGNDE